MGTHSYVKDGRIHSRIATELYKTTVYKNHNTAQKSFQSCPAMRTKSICLDIVKHRNDDF